MAGKSKAELRAELSAIRKQRRSDTVAAVLVSLIQWAGLVTIAFFAYRSIECLAGQATFADVGIEILADVNVSKALAWVFGASGALYGLRQRSLRKTTVERLQDRVRELETGIDPGRSSSGLTPRGNTNPEDR